MTAESDASAARDFYNLGAVIVRDAAHRWQCRRRRAGARAGATGGVGWLKAIIDRTFALDELGDALRLLEERQVFGKLVVTP